MQFRWSALLCLGVGFLACAGWSKDAGSLNYTLGFNNLTYTTAISMVGDTTQDGTPATVIRGGCANHYAFFNFGHGSDQMALSFTAPNGHRWEWHNLKFLDMLMATNTVGVGPVSTLENCWFENMFGSGGLFPANSYTYPNRTLQNPNDFSEAQTTVVHGCTYKAITYPSTFFGSEFLIENNTVGPHQSPAIFANDGAVYSFQWLIGASSEQYASIDTLLCNNLIVRRNTFINEMPESTPQKPVYGNMLGIFDHLGDPNYNSVGMAVICLNTFVNSPTYNVGPALGATIQNVSINDNTFVGCLGGDRTNMSGIYIAAQGGGPQGGGGGTISSVAVNGNTFIRCSSALISATTSGIHDEDAAGGPVAWNGGGTGTWTDLTIAGNVIIDQLRQGLPNYPGTFHTHTIPCIDLQGLATTGFGGNAQVVKNDFTRSGMKRLTDKRFENDQADASCVYLDESTSGITVDQLHYLPNMSAPENFITNLNPTGNLIFGGKSNGKHKPISLPSPSGRPQMSHRMDKQMRAMVPVFWGHSHRK